MDMPQKSADDRPESLRYFTLSDLNHEGFNATKAHEALTKGGILKYVVGDERTKFAEGVPLNTNAILLKETASGIFQRFLNARDKINRFTDSEKKHLIKIIGEGKINLNAGPNIIKYTLPLILVHEDGFSDFAYTDIEQLFSRLDFFIRHRNDKTKTRFDIDDDTLEQ